MKNKKIGKKFFIGTLIFVAVLIVVYLLLILRLEIKYSAKVDYNGDIGACSEQKGDYSVYVQPWFAYENYASIEKIFYDEEYECNATVSLAIRETIFGYRTMVFSVHTDVFYGSFGAQFDENLNYTKAESSVIPLDEDDLERIASCQSAIYDVMREADALWNLGLNIPE